MNKSRLAGFIVRWLAAIAVLLVLLQPGLFLGTGTAHAGDNIWTWVGLGGGVGQITTDPLNPSVVYAIVNGNSLMRSSDGGSTWANKGSSTWSWINGIAVAPSAPNVLYAAIPQSGVYRSVDSGATWQAVYADSTVKPSSVTVSPVNWQEAYIVLAGVDVYNSIIMKTIDGGEHWTTISSGLPPEHAIHTITIAPSAPHILIAKPWNTAPKPLYKSVDAGQTWTALPGPYSNVNLVAFDPKNSNTIYLGMLFSPGAWKSTDGGSTWQPLANGLQQNVRGLVIDPDNTRFVHAASADAGVFESADGGQSWVPINTGIQGLGVGTIAIASRNPLSIYAGVGGAGIWKMTRTNVQNYGITVNDGALFTNQTNVTLTLTAPPNTTQMQISNDGGFGGAPWQAFSPTQTWGITAYGNYVIPRVVYAKFITNGLVTGTYQDDIVLDQTPPSGAVQIANTATTQVKETAYRSPAPLAVPVTVTMAYTQYLPFTARNYRPGFRLVVLLLSASDDVSGVEGMLIANDAGFVGAQWQAYAQKQNWYVNERGTSTIYVKYRDRAGNISPVFSATSTWP